MTVSANAQQLIDAIESMEQGIALFDADDRLVLCNQTFRGVFEDSAAPVIPGATFETMIRSIAANGLIADAQEREEDWVRDRLAYHRKPSGPIKQYLADGRCLQINEYRTAAGGTISIQADITNFERREAARQVTEEHTRSIVETVIDGIITFDADGTIETFNPAAETIFGYAADEVLGKGFSILMGDAEQREYDTLIKRYVDEGDQPDFLEIREVMGRRNGGNEFPLEIAIRELRGTWTMHERRKSQRYKFIATLRDISTSMTKSTSSKWRKRCSGDLVIRWSGKPMAMMLWIAFVQIRRRLISSSLIRLCLRLLETFWRSRYASCAGISRLSCARVTQDD